MFLRVQEYTLLDGEGYSFSSADREALTRVDAAQALK